MRKFLALCLVALLSMTMTLALMSCGGQQAEPPAQTETAPTDQSMMSQDTSMMHADSAMADTSMGGH